MTAFRLVRWLFVGLTVCFAVAPIASAGVGFQPVSPEELKMTSEPQAPGAHAVILYRQVDRDDNIKTPHEDIYFRIKVLSEEGRKYANVEIPFSKGSEEIVSIHARTIRPDGSIADLGSKPFDKELVSGKMRGREMTYLAKSFALSDVQVGSVIEYYYTKDFYEQGSRGTRFTYFNLYGSEWILSNELFTKKVRFSLKPYLGEVDSGVYHSRFSIRWVDSLPTGVSPNDAPEAKLRKLYDRVQQLRNTTYEPQKTEQEQKRANEKSNENVNAEDVWKRGYGNRVELTWLFLGLARAAGFEAYGCWVSDRRISFFSPVTMEGRKLDANVD